MKLNDLTGKTYNRLTVIERDRSRKGVYWRCRCECGNVVSVRAYNLTTGSTKSCGCLNAENIHMPKRNYVDITGKRYGKLEVLRYIDSGKNGTRWECKCHACGSITVKTASWLKNYKSCGCLEKAAGKNNVEKLHRLTRESGSTPNILREKANANNSTTGIRGVTYNSSSGKYVAYIGYQSKRYTLCRSTDINKCIKARKDAEKAIREDFSEWYENFKKENEKNEKNNK